jgi:putative glutamine amidotransferase
MKNIIIGITDCSKYSHYQSWIENETGVEIIKLSYHNNNFNDIQKCDGIILTGGHDVHPRFYNKPEYLEFCNPKNIDERRDEFEWKNT